MKNWTNKNKLPIIAAFVGALLGFLYWYYIGCVTGSCSITSVWYRTMLYGAVMGWLIGDIIKGKVNSSINKKSKNKNL